MALPPMSAFTLAKVTEIAEVDVSEATVAGAGVGFPGTSANTNWRAGLCTDPIVFVASILTLRTNPVREESANVWSLVNVVGAMEDSKTEYVGEAEF